MLLGLAHGTALAAPPTAFVLVELAVAVAAPLPAAERPTPVGIRDGPSHRAVHRPSSDN